MGGTIEDMEIKLEQKDNRREFLENKLGLPDSKVFEEKNRLGLEKYHPKEKMIRVWIA